MKPFTPMLALCLMASVLTVTPALAADSTDAATEEAGLDPLAEARAAIEAEDYAAALPILTALVASEADNADAWNLLGFSSRKSGDLAAAGEAYAKALALNPDHLGALEYQGEMYVELGELDKAAANLARLTELCGTCEEAADLAEAIAAGS